MDAEPKLPAERAWMARAGRALIHASENQGCWPMVVLWLRRLTLASVLLYVVGLLLLVAALTWVGERNAASAFLIYLPPAIWWLPALPLALISLLLHRRAFLLLSLTMLWFGHAFLGWRLGGGGAADTESLRVMTYNRGQHMNQSLQPFKEATKPDIIVFQEASGRAAGFAAAPEYAEFTHTQNLNEHTILSRFPIVEQSAIPSLPGKYSKAVRFVIEWKGRRVAIYSVHLYSPREALRYNMRGAFLYGILGLPGTPWAEKRRNLQAYWDDQIAEAKLILAAAQADSLPVILAGDFNAPHVGYIHRLITRDLGDAHASAGKGCGFTFPGSTRNPLSAGGPWIRIDYVFYNRHWQAAECITEEDRPSQHRAVMAVLNFIAP